MIRPTLAPVFCGAMLLMCALATTPALAQGAPPEADQAAKDERARKLYAVGVEFYEAGRYEAAVEAFEEAYRLSGRHVLLQNIASAQERQGKLDEAISALEKYLPHAPEDKQVALQRRIQAIKDRKAQLAAQTPDPKTTDPKAADPKVADPKTSDPKAGDPAVKQPLPMPKAQAGYAPALKWGTLIGGVGLLVGGGVAYTLGEREHRDLQDRLDAGEFSARDQAALDEARTIDDAAKQKKTLGYILGGVGGALTITSIVLFATDDAPSTSGSVQVGVAPAPGAGMLLIQGRF